MRYIIIIALLAFCIACGKQPKPVVTTSVPQDNDTDTVYVPIVPDTNYFDSLRRNFEGLSRHQDDSLLIYKEGLDVLGVSVKTYYDGQYKETRLVATCNLFSVEFVLPDSLKKEIEFSLEQWNVDHAEKLVVNFTHKPYSSKILISQTWPSKKNIIKKYFFSHK